MRILIILLFILSFSARGQVVSDLGRFSVPFRKGCAPVTVSITELYNFPENDVRQYYYQPDLAEKTDTFHTYSSPGIYEIIQFSSVEPKFDTLLFEVYDPLPPVFNIYQCENQTVEVQISDTYYDYYRVIFDNTDTTTYSHGDPYPAFQFGSPGGAVSVTGHFNNSYPGCGVSSQSFQVFDPIPPDEVTAMNWQPDCHGKYSLLAIFPTSPYIIYQLELSLDSGGFFPIYEGPIADSVRIEGNSLNGESRFCLTINALNACSGEVFSGNTFCDALPASLYIPMENVHATYVGNELTFRYTSAFDNQTVLEKETTPGMYQFIDSIFSGHTLSHHRSRQELFRISLPDPCDSIIQEEAIAPPFLRVRSRDSRKNELELQLDDPVNKLTEVSRELLLYGTDSLNPYTVPYSDLVELIPETGTYQTIQVKFLYNEMDEPVYSNQVLAKYVYQVHVPHAFTPNNDGLNDYLEFFGTPTDEATVSIFNRWGQQVYTAQTITPGWSGYINGAPAPEGIYRYEIRFASPSGELISQSGTFTLITQ